MTKRIKTNMQARRRPTVADEVLGATIRRRRTLRKLSQAALAEKIGVSTCQVQKYKNGTNRVTAQVRHWFAARFSNIFTRPAFLHKFPSMRRTISSPLLLFLITGSR